LLAAISSTLFIDQLVNGITLGMLYILVALGLNIILGLMGVINFSHGAFFMLGAYFTFTFVPLVGFGLAILIAAVLVGLLGMVFEATLIRPLYKRLPEYTLLLTFGTALIITQLTRARWGDLAVRVEIPPYLAQPVMFGTYELPFYRDVFLVVLTIVILTLIWLLMNKTNIGIIIRAGTRDAEMVKVLGINMPAMLTFVIVIVGGIGSFWGSIVGGLLIGVVASFMSLLWPPAVEISGYVLMGIILLIRPRGLFGVEGLFE
jgi:branched-chain amino acid transport system permease protein